MSFTHFFYTESTKSTSSEWASGTHLHPTNCRQFFDQRCVSLCSIGRKLNQYSDPQSMYLEMRSAGTGARAKSSEWTISQREEFAYPRAVWRCHQMCRDTEHFPEAGNTAGGKRNSRSKTRSLSKQTFARSERQASVSWHCSSCSDTDLIPAPPENQHLGFLGAHGTGTYNIHTEPGFLHTEIHSVSSWH